MRQIASLPNEDDAHRFAAYLITQGITAHAEEDGEVWAIWVRDENHLDQAREEFSQYQQDPRSSQYDGVERKAESILTAEARQREEARRNVVEMRNNWNRGQIRRRPLVLTMIVLSVLISVLSGFANLNSGYTQVLLFANPVHDPRLNDQADGDWDAADPMDLTQDIRQGQIWRLFTPNFLHGDWMHLIFNMIIFYQLGSRIEDRRGTVRIGLLILAIGVFSSLAQSLVPPHLGGGYYSVGMSGVVFGLFGYLWMKSVYEPELQLHISPGFVSFVLIYLFLCMSGLMEQMFGIRIANWAHGVGLLVGMVVGVAPVYLRSLSNK